MTSAYQSTPTWCSIPENFLCVGICSLGGADTKKQHNISRADRSSIIVLKVEVPKTTEDVFG